MGKKSEKHFMEIELFCFWGSEGALTTSNRRFGRICTGGCLARCFGGSMPCRASGTPIAIAKSEVEEEGRCCV
jgi:hypothetical protein